MYYEISRSRSRVEEGINISITDKDGNLPVDCIFCGGIAKLHVADENQVDPILQIRVCDSQDCYSKAVSYILQIGHKFSPEGSCLPGFEPAQVAKAAISPRA